jgi:hypothetical protein
MPPLNSPFSRLATYGIAAGIAFALLSLVFPNEFLLTVFNSLCIGIVGVVTIVFFPLMRRAWHDKAFDRISQLVTGMALMWLSLLGSRLASLYISITNDANGVAQSPVVTFIAYIAILGGVLHISAPGMSKSEWKYDKRTLGVGVGVGIIIAIIAFALQAVQ